MGRFSWVFRLALVIGAGALLTTAVVVAVAPRVWRIANAHEELPTDLPDFEPLAQRTYVYDTEGNEIAGSVASATRPAGKYTVKWDGKDAAGKPVKPGKYAVAIEAAREHGTYQIMRQEVDWNGAPAQFTLPGNQEISGATIDAHKAAR